jgi:hypothetical protein
MTIIPIVYTKSHDILVIFSVSVFRVGKTKKEKSASWNQQLG